MNEIERVRELLSWADTHRKIARGADMALTGLRRNEKAVRERSTNRFGFRKSIRGDGDLTFEPLPREVQDALYEALIKVRTENTAKASDYEQRAITKETP